MSAKNLVFLVHGSPKAVNSTLIGIGGFICSGI